MDRLSVSSITERRNVLRMAAMALLGVTDKIVAHQDQKSKDKDSKPTVYTPGGDVKAPKVVHYVEPEFSNVSKEAFVDGVVKMKTTVTPDGMPIDIEVTQGLNAAEDRTAVEAVKQWRFQPGTKSGEPVHVRVGIEIAFHLM